MAGNEQLRSTTISTLTLGSARVVAQAATATLRDEIRLVARDGGPAVIMARAEAVAMAAEAGLDLIEVDPTAQPPVCKIMDAGRWRYEQSKREHEQRRRSKACVLKELKLRPGIEENDFQVKLRSLRRFLEDGDRVRILVRFSGREIAHPQIGRAIVDRLIQACADLGQVEQPPRHEGRQILATIGAVPRSDRERLDHERLDHERVDGQNGGGGHNDSEQGTSIHGG